MKININDSWVQLLEMNLMSFPIPKNTIITDTDHSAAGEFFFGVLHIFGKNALKILETCFFLL